MSAAVLDARHERCEVCAEFKANTLAEYEYVGPMKNPQWRYLCNYHVRSVDARPSVGSQWRRIEA